MADKKPAAMSSLNLPQQVFAGVHFNHEKFTVSIGEKNGTVIFQENVNKGKSAVSTLTSWLSSYMKRENKKIISAGIISSEYWKHLYPKLWLSLDIVPVYVELNKASKDGSIIALKKAAEQFGDDYSHIVSVRENREVEIMPLVALSHHEEITPPEEFKFLLDEVEKFKGKKVAFYSATPQGGGVAILRHGMMRLFRLLDVDASWFVLQDDAEAFNITKRKFHNILQGVAEPSAFLTEDEKAYFDKWSGNNAEFFGDNLGAYDVVVIDDPQPSGLISKIRQKNPSCKIIYRSHIELLADAANKKGTPQNITWEFIWDKIKNCDLFISHPVRSFVPKNVPQNKVVYAPPCTDPLDGLNKELTDEQKDFYTRYFDKLLIESGQTPLYADRPYIVQIARFDPSKGIPDLLQAYKKLVDKYDTKTYPQLLIVGNGSIDDPDGIPILNLVNQMLLTEDFKKIRQDIKVIRLPHYDQLLNTLARNARIVLQLSYREGFEFKIAEGLMKGKPVVIYDSGGMSVQVKDGKNGYVVKKGDIDDVVEKTFKLLNDDNTYTKFSQGAKNISIDVHTVSTTASWLWLFNALIKDGKIEANGKYIKDLTGQSLFKIERFTVKE